MADPNKNDNSSDTQNTASANFTELRGTILAALEALIEHLTQQLLPEDQMQIAENIPEIKAQLDGLKMRITQLVQARIESLNGALDNYGSLMELEACFVGELNDLLGRASWIIQGNFDTFCLINKTAKADEQSNEIKEKCKAQVIQVSDHIKRCAEGIVNIRESMKFERKKVEIMMDWRALLRRIRENW